MARRSVPPGDALIEQSAVVAGWLREVPDGEFGRPSGLPGWSTADLVGHLVVVLEECADALGRPTRAATSAPAVLFTRHLAAAEEGAAAARRAGALTPSDLRARLDAAVTAVAARVADASALPRAVQTAYGSVAAVDFLATRTVEVVVHSEDLGRSQHPRPGPPLHRPAASLAVRTLAAALAAQHPGRSVEVRIPPYAAVQVGHADDPGPTHTRGTPPNVVETDPVTFLRLATGRLTWADARSAGRVSASGLRADLAALLPVLR